MYTYESADCDRTGGHHDSRVHRDDGSFTWAYKDGISDVTFHIAVREKGGLLAEDGSDSLVYTDERSDYPDLTDEQFANFRAINTTVAVFVGAFAVGLFIAALLKRKNRAGS